MGHFVSIRRNGALAETPTVWVFLAVLAPAAVFLAALRLQPWVPAADLVRDGVVASVGSLLWIGTASICLFTALVIHAAQADRSRSLFLLAAGLVTLWLGLDHVFMVHKELLPSFGIPRTVAEATYAAIGALYLLISGRLILSNRPSLLLAAALFLGASLGFDGLLPEAADRPFAEEGLTFLAIAFWAGFHVAAAARAIEELATGRITTVTMSPERLTRKPA